MKPVSELSALELAKETAEMLGFEHKVYPLRDQQINVYGSDYVWRVITDEGVNEKWDPANNPAQAIEVAEFVVRETGNGGDWIYYSGYKEAHVRRVTPNGSCDSGVFFGPFSDALTRAALEASRQEGGG